LVFELTIFDIRPWYRRADLTLVVRTLHGTTTLFSIIGNRPEANLLKVRFPPVGQCRLMLRASDAGPSTDDRS